MSDASCLAACFGGAEDFCLALGRGLAGGLPGRSLTPPRTCSFVSQIATMFSLLIPSALARPRPPAPMMAMLSFSLGERLWAGVPWAMNQNPIPAKALFLKNSRRLVWRLMRALLVVLEGGSWGGHCLNADWP